MNVLSRKKKSKVIQALQLVIRPPNALKSSWNEPDFGSLGAGFQAVFDLFWTGITSWSARITSDFFLQLNTSLPNLNSRCLPLQKHQFRSKWVIQAFSYPEACWALLYAGTGFQGLCVPYPKTFVDFWVDTDFTKVRNKRNSLVPTSPSNRGIQVTEPRSWNLRGSKSRSKW